MPSFLRYTTASGWKHFCEDFWEITA